MDTSYRLGFTVSREMTALEPLNGFFLSQQIMYWFPPEQCHYMYMCVHNQTCHAKRNFCQVFRISSRKWNKYHAICLDKCFIDSIILHSLLIWNKELFLIRLKEDQLFSVTHNKTFLNAYLWFVVYMCRTWLFS